jgi:hypothetical protein
MNQLRLVPLVALAASIGGCDDASIATMEQSVVGVCTRNPAQLLGPPRECGEDLDCPCGAHCNQEVGTCTYACLPDNWPPPDAGVPPPTPMPCAAGLVCDDTGQCTTNADPPEVVPILSANPPGLTTVANGPSKSFEVRLRLTDTRPHIVEAAEDTIVRLIGHDGAEVSCNGTTFHDRCSLTTWTFALDGQGLQATKQARVRTTATTRPGRGEVLMAIQATGARVIVPAAATPPLANEDGQYVGVATSSTYPHGLRVTAVARARKLLVREPSRTIAPDGALLLDVNTTTPPTVRRKSAWLREAGAPDTAGAIIGDYIAGKALFDPAVGTLSVPLSFNVPDAPGIDGWTIALQRIADTAPECGAQIACATGSVCNTDLQACVPAAVDTPPTAPVGNALIDQRSNLWWDRIKSLLETPSADSAFNTTGADLVESVLCSTQPDKRGWLGAAQVMRPGTALSRSGDLGCLMTTTPPPPAPPGTVATNSSGAVGLATLADRSASDAELVLQAIHGTCLTELARAAPAANDFAAHFGLTVTRCANLSRFVPAMRLLAADPLNKGTSSELEPRVRGLAVRLVQQWSMLQGFLAATGTTQQDHATWLNPTPSSTNRTALIKALDAVDLGWNALLDQRIAPLVRNAGRWSPSNDMAATGSASRDYRLLKQPIVYWTFNNPVPPSNPPPNTPPGPTVDIVRGVELVLQASTTDSVCRIAPRSFAQGFNCPGYAATLPDDAPSLVEDPGLGGPGKIDNLTITLNADGRDRGGPGTGPSSVIAGPVANGRSCPTEGCDPPPGGGEEDPPPPPPPIRPPPYRGGTLIATPTLAIGESVEAATLASTLVLVHPSAGGPEITTFTGYGTLGTPLDPDGMLDREGTTITVVRDARRKTYTLYVRLPQGATWEQTKSYARDPSGTLDWVPAKTIRVGAAGALPPNHYWTAYKKSYGGYLDDIAVFDSALSATEVRRFAADRAGFEDRRTTWPVDMRLQVPAPEHITQEIAAPMGAQLLEAAVAELELAGRLLAAMQDRAQVACDVDPTSQAGATARAEIAAAVARVGRIVRRSHLLEGLVASDTSERAADARRLIAAKRLELGRAVEPARCTEPFQMADDEVPLYHDTITEGTSETDAFFAASGFLQGLALQHASLAATKRSAAENAYVNARASQIQQVEADNIRSDRLLAIKTQYGDALRRLCGLSHQTNEDFVRDNFEEPDPAHPFSTNTCYVVPTAACLAQHNGPITEIDPRCYRGQLGEILVSLRASYYAHQAAYQSWTAATGNAEAAGRFCVWKEVDAFGCTVTDRHELTDPRCVDENGNPRPYQGTIELIGAFNDYMTEMQRQRMILTTAGNTVGGMLSGAASGGPGVIGGFIKGVSDGIGAEYDLRMQNRQRKHQLTLTKRAAQADIEACWNQAEQHERATQAADMSAKQAFAQFEAAGIALSNAVAEADQQTLELRAALVREANRPSIPIAFHYWLGEAIAAYETELEIARRYTYLALRATEYDMQEAYKTPAGGKPLRSAVLAASHPQQLLDQITLMQAQTNQRMLNGRRPAHNHLTFDVGEWLWGLAPGAPLTTRMDARLRDVFDKNGVYLGKGLRFSFVPQHDDEAPVWRCAERIWRVAVGAINFPATQPNFMVTKLIKRNAFASRRCGADGMQFAKWRSKVNLFVATGEQSMPDVDEPLPAHAPLISLDGVLEDFRTRDNAYNNSSRELSLLGLYGDYILLFPRVAIAHGLAPRALEHLNIRFDYLSVDDTPSIPMIHAAPGGRPAAPPVEIKFDEDTSPITLD